MTYLDRLFSLKGKTALVTGASRGVGRGIANALLGAAANVILVASNEKRLETSAEAFRSEGYSPTTHRCDLTDRDQLTGLITHVEQHHDKLDILVNAAGTTSGHPVFDYPDEDWDNTFRIHTDAPFMLARGLGKLMRENGGGSIINITSINSERGFPGNPAYVAAKGALKQLTKALALDLGPYGIRVNNIGPGYFKTDATLASWNDPERREQRSQRTILGRWGDVSELAGTVILLASDASSYITGQDIYVDGGWLARGM